ncbi:FAD protein [Venustampulla echinocandica]|uniref:FAD protein n=1 Tax=Venustampulla echinocandica TaxID=2656787 RepID=A0A370U218_9HELO|nr:FAD protein [Venustampulla echinocandica]RDL41818.1 FAD protein [Venustampulla echinocandica]
MSSSPASPPSPKSALIVGSGVFGLSTALALSTRPSFATTTITVLDRLPFPAHDASSVDSSRIIRADYADPAYAGLASKAQSIWRQTEPSQLGGEGRYSESGLVLVADTGNGGEHYVRESYSNVVALNKRNGVADNSVTELPSKEAIAKTVGTGGGSGDWGYINRCSGWADAEAGMKWLRAQVDATKRVTFKTAEVISLLYSPSGDKVTGVRLKNNTILEADFTILATGAWTPSLIDLRGRSQATGQVIGYIPLTDAEQEKLGSMPMLLNMSTGMFIIPPRNNVLKVARHGYGYTNPVAISNPSSSPGKQEEKEIIVSLPATTHNHPDLTLPPEAQSAMKHALQSMLPTLPARPFSATKICWYTDTPTADFIITYHPNYNKSLFLATGGSGHGYKFLPVIGDCIADCIESRCPPEFREKWRWRENVVDNVVTEDGSRGGRRGMVLWDEMARTHVPSTSSKI